ncbi:DUF4440 domain-containing protein [Marilutibacter chinensis]|uniref:DUF4440 domain-containing protein n=1 Tax=Marilutibacter chinensis TaxID=2912247 RepID=A0ABS9HWC2_9GAMM|nr:DUF4440 domain-containing protein [Lysobacter chinensis]MCF7222484.1 DUF4440 domain-containing protein [Lysobacter chinensis]
MDTTALQARILELERRLLQPDIRASVEALDALIADDFLEFASTGRSFGKAEVLARLPREAGLYRYSIAGFAVRVMAGDLVLATYRATIADPDSARPPRHSLRSSLWRRESVAGHAWWRMVFHQGTPTTADRDQGD